MMYSHVMSFDFCLSVEIYPVVYHRLIQANFSDAFIVDGEADESDDEKEMISIAELVEPSTVGDMMPGVVKYDNNIMKSVCAKSSFHSSLNGEMKVVIQNLRKFNDVIYNRTKVSVNMMQPQLMATYSLIQNVSYNLRISSNDLFYLEDHVDLIIDCADKFPSFSVD